MTKKIFSILLILFSIAVISGCRVSDMQNQVVDDAKADVVEKVDNREKGVVADLKVGNKVMVMGNTNQDGSVSASEIMFGDLINSGFGVHSTSTRPTSTRQFVNRGRDNKNGGQRLAGQRPVKTLNMTRLVGEILEIDETSLIIKLDEGGSKIIFYSDKTGIFTMKPPTNIQ